MFVLALLASQEQKTMVDISPVKALVFGIAGALASALFLWICKRSAFGGQRYLLSPEGIQLTIPHVKDQIGEWKDLVFVSPLLGALGFKDGTVINVDMVWRLLTPDQFQQVMSFCGEDHLLPQAFERDTEWHNQMRPKNQIIPFWAGHVIFLLGLVATIPLVLWILALEIFDDGAEDRPPITNLSRSGAVALSLIIIGMEIKLLVRFWPLFKRMVLDHKEQKAFRKRSRPEN